jgi:hypothetical protein
VAPVGFGLVENPAQRPGRGEDVVGAAVDAGDEPGRRRQVGEDGVPAGLAGGDAGHARAGEGVEDEVARLGVVLDQGTDDLRRDLGVVRVEGVHRVAGGGAQVAAVRRGGGRGTLVVSPGVPAPEVRQERVRAGREVRRVGEGEDVLVGPEGEALRAAEGRVTQAPAQPIQEVGAAGPLVWEGHAEAFQGPALPAVQPG